MMFVCLIGLEPGGRWNSTRIDENVDVGVVFLGDYIGGIILYYLCWRNNTVLSWLTLFFLKQKMHSSLTSDSTSQALVTCEADLQTPRPPCFVCCQTLQLSLSSYTCFVLQW